MTEPIEHATLATESDSEQGDYREAALYRALQERVRMPSALSMGGEARDNAQHMGDAEKSPIARPSRPNRQALLSESRQAGAHRYGRRCQLDRADAGLIRRCSMLGVDIAQVLEIAAKNAARRQGLNPSEVV